MKKKVVTNSRDRNLLILLVVLVIAFLLYNYVITPALNKGTLLKEELLNAEGHLNSMNEAILAYPQIQEDEEELSKNILAKYSVFFHEIIQERLLYKLDTLIVDAGLMVNRYACTPIEAIPISLPKPIYSPLEFPFFNLAAVVNPDLIKEPAIQFDEAGIDESGSIPVTDITLDFTEASYEATLAFVRSIENMDKSIVMKNLAINKSGASVDGQIIMSFFSLPHIDNTHKDYLKFNPVIPKGKPNPFN